MSNFDRVESNQFTTVKYEQNHALKEAQSLREKFDFNTRANSGNSPEVKAMLSDFSISDNNTCDRNGGKGVPPESKQKEIESNKQKESESDSHRGGKSVPGKGGGLPGDVPTNKNPSGEPTGDKEAGDTWRTCPDGKTKVKSSIKDCPTGRA